MTFFSRDGMKTDIRVVKLTDWLNLATGDGTKVTLALPMIQRGSVWKPSQVIDLWDSLLRGMPIGAMMVSELPAGTEMRSFGAHKSKTFNNETLALIDGQQRTLAMLCGWELSEQLAMEQRIWIDLADKPLPENLFRIHVTTKNRPFGFQRDEPSKKLPFRERHNAMEEIRNFFSHDETAISTEDILQRAWGKPVEPLSAKGCPIEIKFLIKEWQDSIGNKNQESTFSDCIRMRFVGNNCAEVVGGIDDSIEKLEKSIGQLFKLEVPVIRVAQRFFAVDKSRNIEQDPLLAILFKRIGTGGTQLSDADYIYSIIKHLRPETYNLVESLYARPNVARLLGATDLVMSVVRLAVARWNEQKGEKITDREGMNKNQFQSLLKHEHFIENEFLPLIVTRNDEVSSQTSTISNYFQSIQNVLLYDPIDNPCGLPTQMFPLLDRPLVQILLRLCQVDYIGPEIPNEHRLDVLRLVLFWIVAVPSKRRYDRGSKAKASESAYRTILDVCERCTVKVFGRSIHDQLIEEKLATRLFSPDELKDRPGLVTSDDQTESIPGWNRFNADKKNDHENEDVYLFYYYHWWRPGSHRHPILLWLQREMVEREFGDINPMAGRGEDTPYDYDHIVPSAHWKGSRSSDSLTKFANGNSVWYEGNAIGNMRILSMSENRSRGDKPLTEKFDSASLRGSFIDDNQKSDWECATGQEGGYRSWSDERAKVFRNAVEKRSFALYRHLYETLGFEEWHASPHMKDNEIDEDGQWLAQKRKK